MDEKDTSIAMPSDILRRPQKNSSLTAYQPEFYIDVVSAEDEFCMSIVESDPPFFGLWRPIDGREKDWKAKRTQINETIKDIAGTHGSV